MSQTDGSATLTAKFLGATANGTWTLHLADSDPIVDYPFYVTDPVSISGWQLILTYSTLPSTTTSVSSSLNPSYTTSPNNTTSLTATVQSGGSPISGGTVTFTANNSPIACSGGNQTVSGGTATCTASFSAEGNYSIGAAYSGSSSYAPSSSGETLNQLVINHTTTSGNTYCNPGNLPTTGYTSTDLVYPSYIQVPDTVTQSVASVSVQMNGLQSTNGALSGDVSSTSFLLVSPGKTNNLDFLSHVVTGNPQPSVDVTIADGNPLVPNGEGVNGGICNGGSGPNCDLQNDTTYGPTDDSLTADSFITQAGSPAPPSPNYPLPYGGSNAKTFEQAFSGATAAGNWLLYVENDGGIPLNLSGGWCIDLALNTGAATTTTVTSSKDPAFTGNPVSFTATVQTGGNPVASGSVTFLDNGGAPAGGNNVIALNGSGQAIFTTSQLTEGDHKITASYSGASGYDLSENYVWQRMDDATAIANAGISWQYCNTGAVLGQSSGAYTPNPSNIFVTNFPGTLNSVAVDLNNFSIYQEAPPYLASLIEAPSGAALDFFSNTGGLGAEQANAGNYVFEDTTVSLVPDSESNIAAGSYRPTSYAPSYTSQDAFISSQSGFYNAPSSFSTAAPNGSATFASTFTIGSNPNGTWSLFFNQHIAATEPSGATNGWCVQLVENPPVVTVLVPDTSTFTQGQQGASFTVTVNNTGPGSTGDPTGGAPMTVTDTLNSAFTYANYSGTGWSCSAVGQTVTCTNDSSIAQGSEYPELTIDVNVSGAATGTINNSVTVAGAGVAATPSNTDAITILVPIATTTAAAVDDAATSGAWSGLEVTGASAFATASITPASSGPTLTGSVTYTLFTGSGCSSSSSTSTVTLSSGVAPQSSTFAPLAAGTYSIKASYSGDSNYKGSTSTCAGFSVNRAQPTVSVASTPNPSTFGQSVTFTATVSGVAGFPPTGTVGFTSNTVAITNCTAVTLSSGQAQCMTSSLATGTDTIVATYSGDGNNLSSSGTLAGGQHVNPSTVNVTIGTSPVGLSFSIAGTPYTTTQTPSLTIGTPYALNTTATQPGGTGVQYVFSQWSDGTLTPADTLTPTTSTTSDTAQFTTQYLLTVSAGTGGAIAATTAPNGFYKAVTVQTISATPSAGYYFANWTGANSPTDLASATSATTTVTMNGPENLTANFAPIPGYIVGTLTDDASGNASNCPASPSVGPSCTLRDAITAADANGGNITFNSGLSGTITLTSGLPALTGQITIQGPGANVITVSGNNSTTVGSIFQVNSGATVGISGLTIANGVAPFQGGGISNNSATLTVSNCVLFNNSAGPGHAGGGGIFTLGSLTIENSTFSSNSTLAEGGGILNVGGTLTVTYSTFSGNTASQEGGAIITYGPATVSDSTFSGNKAVDRGGAIANGGINSVIVANSIFSGNSANTGAGLLNLGPTFNSNNNLFYNNLDNQSGGTGLEDDCLDCTSDANAVSGNPNLAPLANYGGPTTTMLPLPASPAICAASSGLVPAGFTMDQRGDPNSTTYNSTKCYDLGAVQTSYALSFTSDPPPTGTVPATAMSPTPVVTVTESGTALTAGSVSLSATDANSDLTTTPATASTSATNGQAAFSTLLFTNPTTADTLTAALPLNPNLPTLILSTQSTSFSVSTTAPTLGFAPSPASQTYGTAIAAGSLDATVIVNGRPLAGQGTFTYTTTIGGVPNQPVIAGTTILPAGAYTITATFTPSSQSPYSSASITAPYTVNQATPTVTWPTASAINYGQALSASTLTGGSAKSPITGATVLGSFAFTSPTTKPTATGPQGVTFTPTDLIDYTAVTSTVTVTVTATPVASISTTAINFGTLYLGSIVTKTVTVTNVGDAAMTIKDPLIAIVQGGDSNEFITVNLCPKSLAAGKSCTMTVTFIAGPFYNPQTATLMINDNAAGSPQTVVLYATVIDPVAQLSARSLTFGTVKVGKSSSSQSVTLSNPGGTALSITDIAIAGADPNDFTETNTCSASLAPKKSCTISVTFKPTAKKARSATLVITDNAQNSPQSISLSDTGN